MSFLEARRILAGFAGGPDLPFLFALSGTAEPFRVYLEAAAAKRGFAANPRYLPFNTLHQHVASGPPDGAEVYLLLPWDFVPESDWRSGIPLRRVDFGDAVGRAEQFAGVLRRRPRAQVLYLPGRTPPVVGHPHGDESLRLALEAIAAGMGAKRVRPDAFSLASYFASGCPVGGSSLELVAELTLDALLPIAPPAAKVLVTDLDETLWSGLIAEEGAEGIAFGPEGTGYRHFAYQTLLARLRREGILLAAVSRNDPDVVRPPLRSGRMPLREDDFVAVVASYHAKSAQIRQLALELNLGLDAFVYVDDNPVELEEVREALPQVQALAFPHRDEELPAFLEQLTELFGRLELTQEDRDRTELYRKRLEGLAPADVQGADLTRFLAGLKMRLVVHDRTQGDRTRAVQLINKTNQFNANGRRWTEGEIAALLQSGGRLLGASLTDRSGSHGEILACLLGPDATIEAFVMSCRVFQRRVEFGFLAALAGQGVFPRAVRVAETERNEPFRQFLGDPAFGPIQQGTCAFDARAFARSHAAGLELFEVEWS